MKRKLPPEIYTPEEIHRVMRVCGRARAGARTRALIALLWRAGLRVSEALALRPQDVHADGTIRVQRGKGGRQRTVAVDAEGLAWLAAWQALRPAEGATFLCTLKGARMTAGNVRTRFARIGARAKLGRRLHAHGLRHTFSMELAREGIPLPIIQAALGHASLTTTSRYVSHFGSPQVLEALRMRRFEGPTEAPPAEELPPPARTPAPAPPRARRPGKEPSARKPGTGTAERPRATKRRTRRVDARTASRPRRRRG